MENDCVSFVKKWVVNAKKDQIQIPTDFKDQSADELKSLLNQLLLQSSDLSKENKELIKQNETQRRKVDESKSTIDQLKQQLEFSNQRVDALQKRVEDSPSPSPSLSRISKVSKL